MRHFVLGLAAAALLFSSVLALLVSAWAFAESPRAAEAAVAPHVAVSRFARAH